MIFVKKKRYFLLVLKVVVALCFGGHSIGMVRAQYALSMNEWIQVDIEKRSKII